MSPVPLSRVGSSLLEMMIALAVLSTVTAVVTQSISMGVVMQEQVRTEADLVDQANVVVKKIAFQLRSADYNWITITSGTVSTYQVTLCTGLSKDGPVFTQGFTLAYDTNAATLTATLTDLTTGKVLHQDVARGVRKANAGAGIAAGFQIGQLGTDEVVTGNQLQITLALEDTLHSGEVVTRSATSIIFLRSTIYANVDLTTTATALPTPPVDTAAPIVSLGNDTNVIDQTSPSKNNLLIKGSLSMPTGTSSTIYTPSFTLTADKPSSTANSSKAYYVITRGWVPAEKGSLQTNEFLLTGWVQGSLQLTATVSATNSQSTTTVKSY